MRKRDLPERESETKDRRDRDGVEIERLEERVALSLTTPKKAPEPPPYPPGTRYSLASKDNLPETPSGSPSEKEGSPEVEPLEERVALSLTTPKKTPEPPPYPPGTLYGLAKREGCAEDAAVEEGDRSQADRAPDVERLEERVALSLTVPKKSPEPPPYPPGADYSLAKRENLVW